MEGWGRSFPLPMTFVSCHCHPGSGRPLGLSFFCALMYQLLLSTHLTCRLLLHVGVWGMPAKVDLKIFIELSGVGSDYKCSKETYMFGKEEKQSEKQCSSFQRKTTWSFWSCGIVLGIGSTHKFLPVFLSNAGYSSNLANTCPVNSWALVSPPGRNSCEAQGSQGTNSEKQAKCVPVQPPAPSFQLYFSSGFHSSHRNSCFWQVYNQDIAIQS